MQTVWIVDVVTWTVLWPTLKNILKDNPVQLAVERGKLFNVYSYVEVKIKGLNSTFKCCVHNKFCNYFMMQQ